MAKTDFSGNIIVEHDVIKAYYDMEDAAHNIIMTENQMKQLVEKLQEAIELNGIHGHGFHLIFYLQNGALRPFRLS